MHHPIFAAPPVAAGPAAPRRAPLAAAALAAGLAAGLAVPAAADDADAPREAAASILGLDGEEIGTATLAEAGEGGVLVTLEVGGLPPGGWVAFHVHEGEECDPADAFESAGGHFNPDGAEHGYHVEGGPHAGDMPNQYVPEDGTLRAEVFNHMVTLEDGDAGIRGRALVFHAGSDDYQSQPSGDAGDRLACGIVD